MRYHFSMVIPCAERERSCSDATCGILSRLTVCNIGDTHDGPDQGAVKYGILHVVLRLPGPDYCMAVYYFCVPLSDSYLLTASCQLIQQ